MRERIANAAMEEMTRWGLKFSLREIAARLGISTKTLYQHFESKEQMIGFIVDRCIADMREAEAELMNDSSLTTVEKLRRALVILPRGFVLADVRIVHELKQRYVHQWQRVDAYLNNGWDNIRLLIDEGIADGSLRPFHVDLFIQTYIGALNQLMDAQPANKIELPLDKMLDQLAELLLLGIVNADVHADVNADNAGAQQGRKRG